MTNQEGTPTWLRVIDLLTSRLIALLVIVAAVSITYLIFDKLYDFSKEALTIYTTGNDPAQRDKSSTQIAAVIGAFVAPFSVILGVFTGAAGIAVGLNQKQQAQNETKEAKQAVSALEQVAATADDQTNRKNRVEELRKAYPKAFGR